MSVRKRILIIGGSGFVGSNLAQRLRVDHSVLCTHRGPYTPFTGVSYLPFAALGDKEQCKILIQMTEPDVVIYAAGSNDPDYAERDPAQATHVHSNGASLLISASEVFKSKFIYLSSSYVFSGLNGNFHETDTAMPSTQLGKAKLGAENYIRSRSMNHIIIRSAPFIGRGTLDHPSWTDRIRENHLLLKKPAASIATLHNPVGIGALLELVTHVLEEDLRSRTFHLGGLTKLSLQEASEQFLSEFHYPPTEKDGTAENLFASSADYSLNFTRTLPFAPSSALSFTNLLKSLN